MKEVTSTLKAFELLVTVDYYWALTGLPKTKRDYYRSVFKSGSKPITLDKMEELLALAGFSVKQEKVWNVPEGTKQ